MGEDVEQTSFTREDRARYRHKIRRSLDVFATMLRESRFEFERPLTGMEIELNLIDENADPAMRNAEVLGVLADPDFQTELGQYNIEINVPPRRLAGDENADLERSLRASLNKAEEHSRTVGAHTVMIGILPTLRREHMTAEALSANPRYKVLNEQIFAARGEDLDIRIDGVDRLAVTTDTIAPESACTSTQFHLQVSPASFSSYWNAAQLIAGVQVALGANSPLLFGRELWRETRIPLFEQATDTRSEEIRAQGVRPRVWFGERWITSVFDLFEENVRYFPALLPICDDEDPADTLERGEIPALSELRLHNGTVYRWNRPIYAVVKGRPHLRVENRVLPAGPTVVDTIANAAFYYGLIRTMADAERPLWTQMSFSAAEENFHTCARHGIDATVFWPGMGYVPVTELVLRRLLPMAHDGLDRWGVSAGERDRLLGIIEQRCLTHRNGAAWQVETLHQLESDGLDRQAALHEMLRRYLPLMHENRPVHEWPSATAER